MSRTKPASRKKTSPEIKQTEKNSAETPKNSTGRSAAQKKSDSEKSQSAKRTSDAFGYDSLAKQTLDLWREQLGHFLNNPDAFSTFTGKDGKEYATTLMSPQISQMFSPLFSGGMDLWLMMLEQLGKAANMNTKGASANGEQKTTATTQSNYTEKYGQGGYANRSAAASALSGASTYAVAQLASRLADLEKRFAEFEGTGKTASRKPAAKKKAASATVVALKRAGRRQG